MPGWRTVYTIEGDGEVTTTQVKAPPRLTQVVAQGSRMDGGKDRTGHGAVAEGKIAL